MLSYQELEEGVKEKIDSILRYPAIYPVENGDKRLSSNFGYRRDPFSNKYNSKILLALLTPKSHAASVGIPLKSTV